MKHIETLPFNDARIMVRSGLEHLQVTHFDMTSKRWIATFALSAATCGTATLVKLTFTTSLPIP
jgi:hypothetical protein